MDMNTRTRLASPTIQEAVVQNRPLTPAELVSEGIREPDLLPLRTRHKQRQAARHTLELTIPQLEQQLVDLRAKAERERQQAEQYQQSAPFAEGSGAAGLAVAVVVQRCQVEIDDLESEIATRKFGAEQSLRETASKALVDRLRVLGCELSEVRQRIASRGEALNAESLLQQCQATCEKLAAEVPNPPYRSEKIIRGEYEAALQRLAHLRALAGKHSATIAQEQADRARLAKLDEEARAVRQETLNVDSMDWST
jgi:hypothetical protein